MSKTALNTNYYEKIMTENKTGNRKYIKYSYDSYNAIKLGGIGAIGIFASALNAVCYNLSDLVIFGKINFDDINKILVGMFGISFSLLTISIIINMIRNILANKYYNNYTEYQNAVRQFDLLKSK